MIDDNIDSDTNSGFNSDSEEISTIAVYGTQAVNVKQEKDPVVTIKLEQENTELEEIDIGFTIQQQFINVPVVYTTRLDQMSAINKIETLSARDVTKLILMESKPLYKQTLLLVKTEPTDINFNSYENLSSQIHQMNSKLKEETRLRNEKLMKLCKPLKIVLVDIMKRKKIIFDADEIANSSSDEESLLKPMSYERVNKADTVGVIASSFVIAVKDKRSQEADIYIIGNKSVNNYYRSTLSKCGQLQTLHNSKSLMLIEYCCWIDREKRIKQLVSLAFVQTGVRNYLRTPHSCLPRPCSCCCVFRALPKTSYNKKCIIELSEDPVFEKTPAIHNNKIIEKAINYVPKHHDNIQMHSTKIELSTIYLKHAVIIIKYHRIMFSQTAILGENYVIGSRGEITDYVRPTVNRSIAEEKHLYQQYDDDNEPRTYFSYLICCWHQREEVIAQLRGSYNLLLNALRFIRTPHLCKVAKCECCCKPTPIIKFMLKNIKTHNIVGLNKEQDKIVAIENRKHPQTYNTRHKSRKMKEIQNAKNQKPITSKTNAPPKASQKRSKSTNAMPTKIAKKSLNKSEAQSTILDNVHLTVDSRFKRNQILTQTIPKAATTDVQQLQPNDNNMANHNSANFVDPTIAHSTVTHSILETFKDLKLGVNEYGKLTAKISTHPGQLTAAEVKVISDILLLASTQIEALGITPQEFCDRVNSSKTPSVNTFLPELVPKYLNAVNKETTAKANPAKSLLDAAYNIVPKIGNLNPARNIFEKMSTLGGLKNQYLVQAYKLHFKENFNDYKAASFTLFNSTSSNADEFSLKKDKVSKPPHTYTVKRKTQQTTVPTIKKLRDIAHPDQRLINLKKNCLKAKRAVLGTKPDHTIVPSLTSNNIKPLQNSNIDTLQLQTGIYSETPLNVANEHVRPLQTTIPINDTPIPVKDSNVLPVQNTRPKVLNYLLSDNNETAVNTSNYTPLQNIIDTVLETKLNTDEQAQKTDVSKPGVADDYYQRFSDTLPLSKMVASVSTNPTPTENPLLSLMLSKTSHCPRQNASKSASGPRGRQISVAPLIRAQTKNLYKKEYESKPNINVAKLKQITNISDDDVETLIMQNVIHNKRTVEFSQDEILEAVNNKELMVDDDVEEGIFGV